MLAQHIEQLVDCIDCPETIQVLRAIPTLFAAIEHGGDDHRDWLEKAIEAHFMGTEMPEYKK